MPFLWLVGKVVERPLRCLNTQGRN